MRQGLAENIPSCRRFICPISVSRSQLPTLIHGEKLALAIARAENFIRLDKYERLKQAETKKGSLAYLIAGLTLFATEGRMSVHGKKEKSLTSKPGLRSHSPTSSPLASRMPAYMVSAVVLQNKPRCQG